MSTEIRTVTATDLRAISGDRPSITGRAIVYDSLSEDLGGFREKFAPGSVRLDADLLALFDHDTSMVLGRSSAGTLEAADGPSGVDMTAYPPDTTWARDLRVSMERGDIKHMSFRFYPVKDSWDVVGDQIIRTVLEAEVSELSVVSMPAYPQTSSEARDKVAELRSRIGSSTTAGTEARSPEDNVHPLTPRQEAIKKALEGICDVFGPFDTTTGPDGAHYVAPSPFPEFVCSACALFEGPRACEIVSGDIDPDAICKFWTIPADLLATDPAAARSAVSRIVDALQELRAGRVLSQDNYDKIAQAGELLAEVITAADSSSASRSSEDTETDGGAPEVSSDTGGAPEVREVFVPSRGIVRMPERSSK